MNSTNTPVSRIVALVLGGLVVAGLGAASMYFYLQKAGPRPAVAVAPSAPVLAIGSGNIAITLTPESASRAGIETARPTAGQLDAAIKVPGIVEPNAYNQVVVRSVAAGQVRSVAVDLGTDVRRGDLLATIHTPDLAETLRVYLSMLFDRRGV